ncbi:MAG: LamB/YcsF family protein, partial [Flammeovirgaceae bacterium]|nr:LamB/YcsF family protein [Flammeovirgaceae bacterium]
LRSYAQMALHHIKPHGALYTMAAKDKETSGTIAKAVKEFDRNLIFYGLSGSFMIDEANRLGLKTANEVFADRTYQSDGSLTPRGLANALITDKDDCVRQVLQMIIEGKVTAVDQQQIPVRVETICLHGDGLHAVEFAQTIRTRLTAVGIIIKSVS